MSESRVNEFQLGIKLTKWLPVINSEIMLGFDGSVVSIQEVGIPSLGIKLLCQEIGKVYLIMSTFILKK
jgi:hypothetical protein